jgi:uncharacterized membrane-anchored protein YhcB (DUF1043 family)
MNELLYSINELYSAVFLGFVVGIIFSALLKSYVESKQKQEEELSRFNAELMSCVQKNKVEVVKH